MASKSWLVNWYKNVRREQRPSPPPSGSPGRRSSGGSGGGGGRASQPTSPPVEPIQEQEPTYSGIQQEARLTQRQIAQQTLTKPWMSTSQRAESFRRMRQIQQQRKQIQQYKEEGFKPERTEEGYIFKPTDKSRLKWSERQLKRTESLPPVLREIEQARIGFESATLSLVSPIGNLFGEGGRKGMVLGATSALPGGFDIMRSVRMASTVKPYTHFVSPLDVGFERVGWSPKGSTALLTKYPAFAAGGITSEISQSIAMTKALKPISLGVKTGTKTAIRKLPALYGKFTKVFPEERIVSPFARRVGTTTVGRRVYLWGAKGYRFGQKVLPGASKASKVKIGLADATAKRVPYKLKMQRVFLSPSQYEKASKEIAKKVGQKSIDITFPTIRTVGSGKRIIGTVTQESYKMRGLFRKSLVRTAVYGEYSREISKGGGRQLIGYKFRSIPLKGGFTRFALEGADEPIQSTGWYAKTKQMYKTGYTQTMPTESGALIDYNKGFGSIGSPLLDAKPGQYRRFMKDKRMAEFIRDGGAMQPVAPQIQFPYTVMRETPSTLYRGGRGVSFVIPSQSFRFGFLGGFVPIGLKSFRRETKRLPYRVTIPSFRQEKGYGKLPSVDVMQSTGMGSVSIPSFDVDVPAVPDVSMAQLTAQKTAVVAPPLIGSRQSFKAKPSVGLPLVFPKDRLRGRGALSGGEKLFGKRYRFREFKIPELKI